jgi:hypothetical protein
MAWKVQCQLELDDNLWITQKGPTRALTDSRPTRILDDNLWITQKCFIDSRPTRILDDNLGIMQKKKSGPKAWQIQGQLEFWMTIYELWKESDQRLDKFKAN